MGYVNRVKPWITLILTQIPNIYACKRYWKKALVK